MLVLKMSIFCIFTFNMQNNTFGGTSLDNILLLWVFYCLKYLQIQSHLEKNRWFSTKTLLFKKILGIGILWGPLDFLSRFVSFLHICWLIIFPLSLGIFLSSKISGKVWNFGLISRVNMSQNLTSSTENNSKATERNCHSLKTTLT